MGTRVLDGGTYTVGVAAASVTLYRCPLPSEAIYRIEYAWLHYF